LSLQVFRLALFLAEIHFPTTFLIITTSEEEGFKFGPVASPGFGPRFLGAIFVSVIALLAVNGNYYNAYQFVV